MQRLSAVFYLFSTRVALNLNLNAAWLVLHSTGISLSKEAFVLCCDAGLKRIRKKGLEYCRYVREYFAGTSGSDLDSELV